MQINQQNFLTTMLQSLKKLNPKNLKSPPKQENNPMTTIDWSDSKCKISKYFTVEEALELPQWNRLANSDDGLDDNIKQNLITIFTKLDSIREYFGKPIVVSVAYRPKQYNELVKGAKNSAHLYGAAVDFFIKNINCDAARLTIIEQKLLDKLQLRMEDLPNSNWLHCDLRYTKNGNNYFKP